MAIAFRSSTNSTIASRSSESVALPAGAANNDIIVVIILKESTGALTVPGLFTDGTNGFSVGTINSTNSQHQLAVYAVRYLTSGQSWPYTVSWTGAVNSQYISVAISGSVTSGSPIVGTPATGSNAGTTGPSLSTTPGVANCLLCYCGGSYDGMTASFSRPANMGGGDLAEDPNWEAFYCDLLVAASTAFTSGTWSTTYGDDHTGVLWALQPAGGAGYTDCPFIQSPNPGKGPIRFIGY